MFTRIVQCQIRAGKSDETAKKIRNEVLPILQKQPGFVDLVTLRDNDDPQRLLCLSFWNTQEKAEYYHREHYDSIVEMLDSVLETSPSLETLHVEVSTAHDIVSTRAA